MLFYVLMCNLTLKYVILCKIVHFIKFFEILNRYNFT